MLDIKLLGQFNLRLEDHPIEIPSRPAQSLLAYLALRPGEPQRREKLAGQLWPDASEANARSYLRQALWRIRKALEASKRDYFLADDFTITFLADAAYSLDVAVLAQEVTTDTPTANLLRCVEVYHGELLPGFYDEWVEPERERLQAIYEHKLALLLDRLAAERRWPGVLEWAERWIALGSVPEPAYRALMLAHHALGDRASMAAAYQRGVEALQRELAVEPSDMTRALYEQLSHRETAATLLSQPPAYQPPSTNNLPRQLTTFIGREREVADVMRLLTSTPTRLVTLTGSGGCGKTRLALEVSRELLSHFPQGVWFIALAPLADPALITSTVAATLGLREEQGRPIVATLIDYLCGRESLLIMDNCEHLIEASAQLIEALLRSCADVRILASSREQLGIAGETAFRVPSLSIPEPRHSPEIETLAQYEAVQLFVDRAVLALPGFALTHDHAAAVVQICRRLDGIPLAIELAAARVNVLRVEQIASRLVDAFRLLTGGSRTALPRQQTLRATMDWSYSLLSEAERVLLRRLAVFAGGWTLEAAEFIGGDEEAGKGIQPEDVLDLLSQLVHKSLVMAEREQGAEARYRLLETIRQYAREKLLESGEGVRIRDRHLDYFMALAERAEPELRRSQQVTWLNRLEDEMDNLRVALDWSIEGNVEAGLRLASTLWQFNIKRGYIAEVAEWLLQLLEQSAAQPRTAIRAKAAGAAAMLVTWQGNFVRSYALSEESLTISRELGDRRGEAFGLHLLGDAACLLDDYAFGRPLVLESLQIYRALWDLQGISETLLDLGSLVDNKDYGRACVYLQESLGICRERGDVIGIANALNILGLMALRQGDFLQARRWLEECLAVQRPIGDDPFILAHLGELALRQGDYAQARAYYEQSLSVCQEQGQTVTALWATVNLGYIALREGDEAGARATFAEVQQRFQTAGSKIGVVYALEGLASLATRQNKPERAVRLFAWADAMRITIGDSRPPVEQADVVRDFAVNRAQLDEVAVAAVYAAGQDMTMEQAVAYALA
jgi:non-specific serine/threonine protein kinase